MRWNIFGTCSCICSFQVIVSPWDTLSSFIFYKEHEIDDINTLLVFHPCQMYPIVISFPNFVMSTSFPSNILECNDESSHLCLESNSYHIYNICFSFFLSLSKW
jgi:hypothetical protein